VVDVTCCAVSRTCGSRSHIAASMDGGRQSPLTTHSCSTRNTPPTSFPSTSSTSQRVLTSSSTASARCARRPTTSCACGTQAHTHARHEQLLALVLRVISLWYKGEMVIVYCTQCVQYVPWRARLPIQSPVTDRPSPVCPKEKRGKAGQLRSRHHP